MAKIESSIMSNGVKVLPSIPQSVAIYKSSSNIVKEKEMKTVIINSSYDVDIEPILSIKVNIKFSSPFEYTPVFFYSIVSTDSDFELSHAIYDLTPEMCVLKLCNNSENPRHVKILYRAF